jgi:hypothetical protein
MAVEAKSRLQSQRITGAEPDRLDAVVPEQELRQLARLRRRHGDLKAILAGISGAGDVTVDAAETNVGARHEGEAGRGGR